MNSTGTAQEVFCLEAPNEPIPACIESRTAKVVLPLKRAIYLDVRPGLLEAGGLAASAREPGRADRSDAAFVQVEQGRVTKIVRDHDGGKRRSFLAQAAGYHVRSSDGVLSLWRGEGTALDLGVKLDLGATGGDRVRLRALGGDSPESVVVAYEGFRIDEERKTSAPFVGYTSVRVTPGPPSEWSASPWRTLPDATSAAFVVTERGVALAALELPREGGEASLVVQGVSEAEEAAVKRFPAAQLALSSLGDVVFAGGRWTAAAAFETGKVHAAEQPACAKPPSLSPPREMKFDEAAWAGSAPGQGGIAVVSQGPAASKILLLETGSRVTPGHLVHLDSNRVAVSLCTRQPDSCYLAVVSLGDGEGVLCSTASGSTPALVAVDGSNVVWVENGLRAVELHTAHSLKGLALRRAPSEQVEAP